MPLPAPPLKTAIIDGAELHYTDEGVGERSARAVDATVKRTFNLARRQMAWFRRDPRIRWFDVDERGAMSALEAIRAFYGRPVEDQ